MKFICSDLTATQTAEILEMNRNMINRYYGLFRIKIYEYQKKRGLNMLNWTKCTSIEQEIAKPYFQRNGNEVVGRTNNPFLGFLLEEVEFIQK